MFDGFGVWRKFMMWANARRFAPKFDGKHFEDGSLPAPIIQTHAEGAYKIEHFNAIWLTTAHDLSAAMAPLNRSIASLRDELSYLNRVLSVHLERYKAEHEGLEPPTTRPNWLGRIAEAFGTVVMYLGELPLMATAMAYLPMSDGEQMAIAISASVGTMFLANRIGRRFAKHRKPIVESLFAIVLCVGLFAVLTGAALIRMDLTNNEKPTSSTITTVATAGLNSEKADVSAVRSHYLLFFFALSYGFALVTICNAYDSTDHSLEAVTKAKKEIRIKDELLKKIQGERDELRGQYAKAHAAIRSKAIRVQKSAVNLMTLWVDTVSRHSKKGRLTVDIPEPPIPPALQNEEPPELAYWKKEEENRQ